MTWYTIIYLNNLQTETDPSSSCGMFIHKISKRVFINFINIPKG